MPARFLFYGIIVLAVPSTAVSGQTQGARTTKTIKAIEYVGLTRSSEAFVQDVARVPLGMPVDRTVLDEAVNRLLGTGRFLSARYVVRDEPDGAVVTFTFAEHAKLTRITFTDNKKYSDGQLLEAVGIKEGERVDHFAAQMGREAIEAKYREGGYRDVTVTYDRERLDGTGELEYVIHEGTRIRIRKVLFEGATAFSARELRRKVQTKAAFWFFRKGAFDPNQVEADEARLRQFFRDQGFLDARVSHRVDPAKKPTDLNLVFVVDEGTRYTIEDIQFRGVAAFDVEDLRADMTSNEGAFVKEMQVNGDVRMIRDRYWSEGYIDAAVRAVRVFSEAPGLVRLTMEVSEGEQFRVGRIEVRGNSRTQDKVARRELNLFPPDDLLDLVEARDAERRLVDTGVFASARVLPVGDKPGVRDVIIDVEESPKSGDFLFGVGVTSNSGLLGTVVLDLKNFDITDWPRSWREFFKFRSFYGAGQRLRLEMNPGTDLSRFRLDFTEPYFRDKPIRLDVSAFFFERGREGYNERRAGTSVSFGKRFRRGRLAGWNGELSFRVEQVRVDDVDLFSAHDIREDEGSDILTSAKVTLAHDRTDNRFLPSTGDRFRVGYEQFGVFGGDHDFGRLTARYQWYKTLKTDPLDRKSVLQLRAEGGVILGDAPVYERFFAGGTGSIRGFEFRGVGPRDGIDDNNIGGDFLVLLGAEYSYPLFGDNVRGHVFLDTGTAGTGTYRAAIGTGVRLTIDILGPVPLEFNLAFPVSTGSDDDEQIFSFLVGSLF